jgi:hypothetical protein
MRFNDEFIRGEQYVGNGIPPSFRKQGKHVEKELKH